MHKSNIKKEFLSSFIPQERPEIPCLLKIREEAEHALDTLEIPTSKDEYWKYTRVAKIVNKKFTQITASGNLSAFFTLKHADLLVFINGFFSSGQSKTAAMKGAIIKPMAKARKENPELLEKYFGRVAMHRDDFFTAMNTVYHTNGAFIHLDENIKLEKPVHIINTASAKAAYNPRNLIVLSENSSAEVILSYESTGADNASTFANVVTEIILGENSRLTLYILQQENTGSYQVNSTYVSQKDTSNADIFTITTGGELIRNNLRISLDGGHCVSHLHGLYICRGTQHTDNHTLVEHKKPDSYSNELYKGIMNDNSTGVFNGKVHVFKHAQKTNAYQSNQNILLSDEASVDTKPELEIYANDVKCSHGSATGQLDEEAIFYLRTRGIGKEMAKHLLINAFASEVIDHIGLEEIKNKVSESVGHILAGKS